METQLEILEAEVLKLAPGERATLAQRLLFPYSIFYQVTSDEIRVVAVAHHRRRPSYWADRK